MRRAQRTDSGRLRTSSQAFQDPPQPGGFFHALNPRNFQMIIVLKREATQEDADEILGRIEERGLKPLYMPGTERVVLGALGDERVLSELGLDGHPMVESIKPILSPYKLVSREMHPHDTIVRFGRNAIGGRGLSAIARPSAGGTPETRRHTPPLPQKGGAPSPRARAPKPRPPPPP